MKTRTNNGAEIARTTTDNKAVAQQQACSGVDLIAAERRRQIETEGWSNGHDDRHMDEELARAAAVYACPDRIGGPEPWPLRQRIFHMLWPFDLSWYKPTPKDRIRELTKAGALCAAEIDRLQRLQTLGAAFKHADMDRGDR